MNGAGDTTSRWLATAGALVALALVGAGAVVNAAQAALSVPDWPLSYGRVLLTTWPGNVAYEQTHRLLAVLTLVLATLCVLQARRQSDPRALAARLPKHLLAALIVQILLGGAVVLWLDPQWLGALHLVLGVGVGAGFLANAMVPVWRAPVREAPARTASAADALDVLRRRNRRLLILVALQILLGGVSRHPVAGQGQFIGTMIVHSLLGLVLVVWIAIYGIGLLRKAPSVGLRKTGVVLLALGVVQLVVGLWVFFISPEPLAPPEPVDMAFVAAHMLHVVAATLMLGLLTGCALGLREPEPA